MPSFSFQPESVLIEAMSSGSQPPATASYVVRTRLKNGDWTGSSTSLSGMYEVRVFLDDKGVESKRIALAIEELSLKRRVQVSCGTQTAICSSESSGVVAHYGLKPEPHG
jgi:hypothetical protein